MHGSTVCMMGLFSSFVSSFPQHVNRATTSIRTWFQSWFCVWWPRQYDLIYLEFHPFLEFFASFLLITYVWNLWMWLVSCMKQGMLARANIRFQVQIEYSIIPYTLHLLDYLIGAIDTSSLSPYCK